jgi:cysteine synthase
LKNKYLLTEDTMASTPPAAVSILNAIGNTPVIKLNHVVPAGSADVYIKLEFYNPTGCYKDRMAWSMIDQAEQRGDLNPGMTVVEATGGSTGSSLAFICALKGYNFEVVCSDAFSIEKLRTITTLGAKLDIIHSPTGKVTADLMPSMIQRAKEIGERKG